MSPCQIVLIVTCGWVRLKKMKSDLVLCLFKIDTSGGQSVAALIEQVQMARNMKGDKEEKDV